MRTNITLTPVQQSAANRLLEGLDAGNIVVLRGAAGSGKTSILKTVHATRGGTLLGAHPFTGLLNACGPSAFEELFLRMIEEAILTHDLVMVDDLHVLAQTVENRDYSRSYLLDAALTAILADAGVLGCKLVFAVEGEAPWPIRRRARLAAIGESAAPCPA